jgi:CO/xanthine dehydrogenase Mo-binding subunit
VPPLAATANAVYNGMAVRIRDMSMSPAVMLKALQEKK